MKEYKCQVINMNNEYVDMIFLSNGKYYVIYDLPLKKRDVTKGGYLTRRFIDRAYERAVNK